jgi:serine/threonine-protein kinase
MGDVYLAEDTRLGRRVALKSPSGSWLRSPDAHARLQREARAAARLNHPSIAAIYDVLDIGGRPFIVIEYVEGEPLSSFMRRSAIPIERAINIGRQLVDALDAAHRAGVIHRDLKPANIMVTPSGGVKVLDFGLARTTGAAAAEGPITQAGQVMGTPEYMAPEQFVGRNADERSDLYSLGAVLYELVTGTRPFEAADPVGRALASLTTVPPASARNPKVPPALDTLLARALALDPRDRFQSASEMKHALETVVGELSDAATGMLPSERPHGIRRPAAWITALVIVAALATASIPIARWWSNRTGAPGGSAARREKPPVIAVLPLENLSHDPKLQFLGPGMAEIMSTKLATVSGLSVINRSEIHEALQRHKEVTRLSQALGASYIVTGSVQHSGTRLQVTINIVRPDGHILYGSIYEDDFDNVFALQRNIAEWLSNRLLGALSADDLRRLARAPAANVQAMTSYWRGREMLENPAPTVIAAAIAEFERATREDPQFALGYAGLGGAYWRMYLQTREREWARKAIESTERARQIDPEEPAVRYALAVIYDGSGRRKEATEELRRLLDITPNSEEAHRLLGDIAAREGRMAEARSEFDAALRVRPGYWITYRALGVAEMNSGNYEAAAAAFGRVVDLQPDSPFGYQLLGSVFHRRGDLAAAAKNYEAAIARGGSAATYSNLGTVYYSQKRYQDAVNAYLKAIELRPRNAVTHRNVGDAHRKLGRSGEAAQAYRRAIELLDSDLAVNPRDASALSLRALCNARLGRFDVAQQEVEHAAQLNPSDAEVQYQQAVVLALAGRKDEALGALRRAFERGYSIALARGDEDLAALRGTREFDALVKDTR